MAVRGLDSVPVKDDRVYLSHIRAGLKHHVETVLEKFGQ